MQKIRVTPGTTDPPPATTNTHPPHQGNPVDQTRSPGNRCCRSVVNDRVRQLSSWRGRFHNWCTPFAVKTFIAKVDGFAESRRVAFSLGEKLFTRPSSQPLLRGKTDSFAVLAQDVRTELSSAVDLQFHREQRSGKTNSFIDERSRFRVTRSVRTRSCGSPRRFISRRPDWENHDQHRLGVSSAQFAGNTVGGSTVCDRQGSERFQSRPRGDTEGVKTITSEPARIFDLPRLDRSCWTVAQDANAWVKIQCVPLGLRDASIETATILDDFGSIVAANAIADPTRPPSRRCSNFIFRVPRI